MADPATAHFAGACGERCSECPYFLRECGGCPGCWRALRESCASCAGCGYLCPGRTGARAFLDLALGGPALPALRRVPTVAPSLPPHVPAISNRLPSPPDPGDLPWVALHGGRVLAADGRGLTPRVAKNGARGAFHLAAETRIILHLYIPDRPLEGFWRSRRELYPALREFDLVVAPNFSVYEDGPRLEHLTNLKRSAVVYAEMLDAGLPAVPDVAWYDRRDLDRWAEWIASHRVPLVAMSLQGVGHGPRSSNLWRSHLAGCAYLAQRLPPDTALLLTGLSSVDRARAFFAALPGRRAHVLNSQAQMAARHGKDAAGRPSAHRGRWDARFLANAKALNAAYQSLTAQA